MPLFQIEPRAGSEKVIPLRSGGGFVFGIVDGDFALADDFEAIALDYDGGALIETDSEKFLMAVDHLEQVFFAMPRDQVLIDRGIAQEAERDLVAGGHHDFISGDGAAHMGRLIASGWLNLYRL